MRWSPKDTAATIGEVREHNARRDAVCGKAAPPPAKVPVKRAEPKVS